MARTYPPQLLPDETDSAAEPRAFEVLCELEDLDEATRDHQLYVGMSRARITNRSDKPPLETQHDVRDLIEAAAESDDEAAAGALAKLARATFRRVPDHGPVSRHTGYRCIRALAELRADDAVRELIGLRHASRA